MEVKRIGNVVIMQEAVKVEGNMYLISIECENRGEDSSPYIVTYYVLGECGGLANVTEEVNNLNIIEINKITDAMLYRLGGIIKGNLHESVYC